MRVLTTPHERDGEGTSASLKKKRKMCRDVRENEMLALNHAETPLQKKLQDALRKTLPRSRLRSNRHVKRRFGSSSL